MNKILTILMLFISTAIFAQVKDTAQVGEYVISTLGSNDYVNKIDVPTIITSKYGVLKADTVFYVPSTAPNDTIATLMAARPVGKKAAIVLQRGSNRTVSLTIPKDSLIIASYGSGAKPVISGFTQVTGWTDEGGGIYSKTLTVESNPEIVTINGVQYAKGRTPNSNRYAPAYADYRHIDSVTGDSIFVDSETNSATTDWTGAEVFIRSSNTWDWTRRTIVSHSGTTIDLGATTGNPNAAGYGYFIQNDLRTLDQFGEWYYGGGKFYMYFGVTNPNSYTVMVSTNDKLINVNTRDYITVKNIKFEGANSMAVATKLSASNAYNLTIDNCQFDFNYRAIYAHQAPNLTVTNCSILRSSECGILDTWYADGAYIAHNTVDSTGLVLGSMTGEISSASGNGIVANYAYQTLSARKIIIEYNIVKNSGRYGIDIGGDSAQVRYNLVDKFCINVVDGAAIHRTNVNDFYGIDIHHNILLNGISNTDAIGLPTATVTNGQHGVYCDYQVYNTTVRDNIMSNVSYGLYVLSARNITITGNTMYNVYKGVSLSQRDVGTNSVRNITMSNNKIVSDAPSKYAVEVRDEDDSLKFIGSFDNNYYSTLVTNPLAFITKKSGSYINDYKSLESWLFEVEEDSTSYLTYNTGSGTIFDYNSGSTAKTVSLTGSYIEADSTEYSTSYTLQPFTGIVLFKDTIPAIDSIYAVYHLDESSGGVLDAYGSHPGTNSGAVPSVAGKFSTAYDFDTNTDNVYFDVTTNAPTNAKRSVSFWLKLDQTASVAGRGFRIGGEMTNGGIYRFDMYISTTNTLVVVSRNSSGSNFTSNSATGVFNKANTWYHVVINFASVGYSSDVFVNGTFSPTPGTDDIMTGTDRTTNYRMYLGEFRSLSGALDGQIDEFIVYNKYLTPVEIAYIANHRKTYPF